MHIECSFTNPSESDAVKALLREAKKLHQATKSSAHSRALPVLRRLLASRALTGITLVELRRRQGFIQRKHILHMLALEAGFRQWAEYRRSVTNLTIEQLEYHGMSLKTAGYPNLWFSSMDAATTYTAEHGGRPIAYGSQAVVLIKP